MLNKLIIVINGKGGVGKDTLCNSLSGRYHVMNVSAIDPIKQIARQFGWNGEKDDRSRRFLAELKQAFIHYNDLPTEYLRDQTEEFLEGQAEILFVHIREADQIERYKQAVFPRRCVTLLVKRDAVDTGHLYGNKADDLVENYSYDYVFENNLPVEESISAFSALVGDIAAAEL